MVASEHHVGTYSVAQMVKNFQTTAQSASYQLPRIRRNPYRRVLLRVITYWLFL